MSEVERLLVEAYNGVVDVMLSRGYRDLTQFQRARLQTMLTEIARKLGTSYDGVTSLVLDEMKQYAQLESDVSRASVNGALGAGEVSVSFYRLPDAYLKAIAKLPIQGLKLGDWFEAQAQTMSRETRRIIQQGLIEGKGNGELARRIMAPDRAMGPKLPPALIRRARREAEAITRTTVNAVQNDASMQSYSQLPASVSDSYRLLVVRDRRTSVICAALAAANRTYRYSDPQRAVPPFHISCRTGVQPILKGIDLSVMAQKNAPMNLRSYGDWLTQQPTTTQNDILGVTRAGFFRDGKISLADAIDADNRVLTLAQLREKIGLDALAAK